MTTVRPELGFERLLSALETDLLAAKDQEILEVADELGMDPTLKGSAALFGVIHTMKRIARKRVRSSEQLGAQPDESRPRSRSKKSSGSTSGSRPRRRSKRGTPPSN